MSAVVDVAAIIGGLTIIGGAAWRWVVGPAFSRQVREIVNAENAAALKPIIRELSMNSGKSVKDVVIRIEERVNSHIDMHERGH